MTFREATFWLGARISGRLIQVADMIEPGGMLLSDSIVAMSSALEGSNVPVHGTNLNMRL